MRIIVLVLGWMLAAGGSLAQDKAFPALVVGNAEAQTKVEFFLSPSCTNCASVFRSSVLDLLDRAARRQDLFVVVAVLPRNQTDIAYARAMSCVPQEKLLPYMTEWYGSMRGPDTVRLERMFLLGKKHGILGSTEAECATERNDRALLSFNRTVFVDQKATETPAVFVNKVLVRDMIYLWQFEDKYPQLKEK